MNIKQYALEISQVLTGKDSSDHITRHLVKGTSGTFVLNVTNYILLFVISILLSRLLGATGYGKYIYALTWSLVLAMPASIGMTRILIRNIADYHAKLRWDYMAGQIIWANRIVLSVSIITMCLAVTIIWFVKSTGDPEERYILWLAMILLPVVTLMRLRQATIQGLHRVVIGQLPESFIQPFSFIILIIVSYVFFKEQLNALWTMGTHAITVIMAFIVSIFLFYKVVPKEIKNITPKYEGKIWLKSGLSVMLIGFLTIVNTRADILMLGAIIGNQAVGIYNIVIRGGELVVFITTTVHASLGPTISHLYTKNNLERLQKVITKSNHIIFILSFPVGVGLILFSYWFLLIFGPEFIQGQVALVIICISKIFQVFMGPVTLLLIMTHHERKALLGLAISAVINIVLNALLIPQWGLEGAAMATAMSTVLWCVLMSILVYKEIRIYSLVL